MNMLTSGEFDVKYPHAFVFPWRSIFTTSLTSTTEFVCAEKIFGDRINHGSHKNTILQSIRRINLNARPMLTDLTGEQYHTTDTISEGAVDSNHKEEQVGDP
jgi:hypothetical protein